MARIITIGNKKDDANLVTRIIRYQKEENFSSAADAVRSLCEDALNFKKLVK